MDRTRFLDIIRQATHGDTGSPEAGSVPLAQVVRRVQQRLTEWRQRLECGQRSRTTCQPEKPPTSQRAIHGAPIVVSRAARGLHSSSFECARQKSWLRCSHSGNRALSWPVPGRSRPGTSEWRNWQTR